MERFLVFAGFDYYPKGGWNDFKEHFDTFKKAEEFKNKLNNGKVGYGDVLEWWQIVRIYTYDEDGYFEISHVEEGRFEASYASNS